MRPIRLKQFFWASSSVFLGIVLITISLLIFSSIRMQQLSETLRNTIDGLYAVEELSLSLLKHNRESYIMARNPTQDTEESVQEATQGIFFWLNEAKNGALSPKGSQLLADAEVSISHYFAIRKSLSQNPSISPQQVYQEAAKVVDDALQPLIVAAERKLDSPEQNLLRVGQLGQLSLYVGLFSSGLILLIFGAFVYVVRVFVYSPLQKLSSSITGYGAGNLELRIKPEGLVEVQDIAKNFNAMADSLAEQRRSRFAFLAGVAHDLRTPLTAILLSIDLLPRPPNPVESTDSIDPTETISRQVKNLDRMVGDLLDRARIESGHLEIRKKKVDINVLVQDAVNLYMSLTERHKICFSPSQNAIVCNCDPERISQVLNNLLSNAIKYSPEGGEIIVQATKEGPTVEIVVEDNGFGMSEDEIAQLFKAFQRGASIRDNIPGLGLGLSVSKKIIVAHGGKIDVTSVPKQGTTFRVTLPIDQP